MNDLVIMSYSSTMPGAVAFLNAAKNLGYQARIAELGSPDLIADIDSARRVLYRLRPQSFDVYEGILNSLSEPKAKILRASLIAFDKLESYDQMLKFGVPMPKSWTIDEDTDIGDYPVIVKVPRGNQGVGVELVTDADQYKTIKSSLFSVAPRLQCQEYIAESRGTDKRIIVAGGKYVTAMIRTAIGDEFRANIHRGATAVAYDPTDTEIDIAIKAVKALGLDYGGVDIVTSSRGPLVLEVNSSPGLSISDVTGVDVATAIVKAVMEAKHD